MEAILTIDWYPLEKGF